MTHKPYLQDLVQLSFDALRKGTLDRRDFLTVAALAGATPIVLGATKGHAAADRIVLWNWGGDAVACHTDAFGTPFSDDTGMGFAIDTSGPLEGSIKAMVESGNVTADVADADAFNAVSLGAQGLLEPIDYSIVDRAKIMDGFDFEYGANIVFYGYAFMYDTERFGDDPPTTWADFFDIDKYPGKRSLYKWANGSLEGALLADGVSPDSLYPLDVPRALRKIEEIKEHIVAWGSGAESQQMIVDNEVSMGMVWQNRGKIIEEDTGGRYRLNMNQVIAMPGVYLTPKGNPAGREAAMRFIASCQNPERQINLFRCHGMTPSNPEALPMIPDDLRRFAITLPENFERAIPADSIWWAENGGDALTGFLDAIAG